MWTAGLNGKDLDAGKDWRLKEKKVTEDEMVGWHHWFNGHELEQTLGDGEGEGSLECCSPQGCKKLNMVWPLNNNNDILFTRYIREVEGIIISFFPMDELHFMIWIYHILFFHSSFDEYFIVSSFLLFWITGCYGLSCESFLFVWIYIFNSLG